MERASTRLDGLAIHVIPTMGRSMSDFFSIPRLSIRYIKPNIHCVKPKVQCLKPGIHCVQSNMQHIQPNMRSVQLALLFKPGKHLWIKFRAWRESMKVQGRHGHSDTDEASVKGRYGHSDTDEASVQGKH